MPAVVCGSGHMQSRRSISDIVYILNLIYSILHSAYYSSYNVTNRKCVWLQEQVSKRISLDPMTGLPVGVCFRLVRYNQSFLVKRPK